MEQDIKNILRDAIRAPSGENCQPWSFRVSGTTINLFNLPDRDQSLYNHGQSGSYISHGALLENIKISALQFGYGAEIKLFPDPNNKNHIAAVVLQKSPQGKSILYEAIAKRVTNRKPYRKEILPEDKLTELKNSVQENTLRLVLTQKDSDKQVLARAGSINESVMISNKFLHNFFFSHVTWTKAEDEQKKAGFFIDTLELPPPAKKMFRLMKDWKMANFLNKLGINKIVGKENAKTYASSSGFGALLGKDTSPEGFVRSGMALEQVWLKATELGLSFQPVSGILFLENAINSGKSQEFTESQRQIIKEGYNSIQQTFSASPDEKPIFMFRFGYGDEPTARSSRFDVESFIQRPQ
jgi:nitroreductase